MQLGFGITFDDLYAHEGISRVDAAFAKHLAGSDVALSNRLMLTRAKPEELPEKEHTQLLIDLAPHIEEFVAELWNIRAPLAALKAQYETLAPLYSCKRLFVQRKAIKQISPEEAHSFDGSALEQELQACFNPSDNWELAFARHVMQWLDAPDAHVEPLLLATRYAAWSVHTEAGKKRHAGSILFALPRKLDMEHLVPLETEVLHGVTMFKSVHHRERHGFTLTDDGGTVAKSLDEANYCIWCHNQNRDSCSKGLKEKDGTFKKSSLGITLAGCPLEERISEMHLLRSQGVPIGALAMITLDNPMCAGTGHRICNDCMKSCVFQKQEPVNIPQSETRALRDVLELPYGFEIYSLLTRWNPLNIKRPIPKPLSGYAVLVAGLGPAGYTLAHHLLNEGHMVVGIDGLKIEPLPETLSGVNAYGEPTSFVPLRDISELMQSLDTRTPSGFGGVAEYGITIRWDKNFLTILRLLLERRRHFSMIGGVRFGTTITPERAWEMGFHHIALCMGAGKPTLLDIPNGLARGVRTASDFLMGLQLSGAARPDSIANLQVRLPVVVVGGGLTAIDTATESLAYYSVQVEKFLTRYTALVEIYGESSVRATWNEEETLIADTFIEHAKALRLEKQKTMPNIAGLLAQWGGATLVYRKRLTQAPSYRLNHEEIEKALEEGIYIAEMLEPLAVEVDGFGHAQALQLRYPDGNEKTLPARTILVAAGTSPNTVLQQEFPQFQLHGKYFQAYDEQGNPVRPEASTKPAQAHMLMALEPNGCTMSFFGDMHPSFAGNVVKAMSSAKQGYPLVSRVLSGSTLPTHKPQQFLPKINHALRARVHEVNRLTPSIMEVVIYAPLAAQAFEPGQFYRLQNFEALAPRYQSTVLAMEGLAMTGAWVDKEKGLVSVIALEMGGSSDLCSLLQKDEPLVLMGPTGTPTEIPTQETVVLVGGGLGNAVLFSIGRACLERKNNVLYFAGYKKNSDRYKIMEIEQAADIVVWCCDEKPNFVATRPQDKVFHGNIISAMLAYASGELGNPLIPMAQADRMLVIGSDRMMEAVGAARHGVLKPYLKPEHTAYGSINSPMQCMLKEICAQCLQQHIDPVTGKISYVYSCFNQDQLLDFVSFPHLAERLKQNSLQEKLTAQWIDHCLAQLGLRESRVPRAA